jgi:hypothetical protein
MILMIHSALDMAVRHGIIPSFLTGACKESLTLPAFSQHVSRCNMCAAVLHTGEPVDKAQPIQASLGGASGGIAVYFCVPALLVVWRSFLQWKICLPQERVLPSAAASVLHHAKCTIHATVVDLVAAVTVADERRNR